MQTIIQHSIIEELRQQFPNGYLALSRKAIVGELGLKIHFAGAKGTTEERFKEGDRLPIREVVGDWLLVGVGRSDPAMIHHSFFKGICN